MHTELAQLTSFLAAHAQHWGLVAPDDAGVGGGYGGGGGGGGGGGREVGAAGGKDELRRESESMSGLYALLQVRVAFSPSPSPSPPPPPQL